MWNAFVAWFQSTAGQRILDGAVFPALAIIVAGVIAALIARSAVRTLLARSDRDEIAGSVTALVEVAQALATGTVGDRDRERLDRLRTAADIRLRLARANGAALAAEWAALRLDAIAREGVSPVRSATAEVDELRDRLLGWVTRPRRAKRLFAPDLERLRAEASARTGDATAREVPAADPAAAAGDGSTAAAEARPAAAGDEREAQPAPLSARAQDRSEGRPEVPPAAGVARAAAAADPIPERASVPAPASRPRLDPVDVPAAAARAEHARHAGRAEATAARPDAEPVAAAPAPPPERPQPSGQAQPTPAWLDTYDDEAEVTRDIDLSKTPPPMSATAVRDRTRSGDDIVPRH